MGEVQMEEVYSLRLAKICTCIFLFLISIAMGILPHKWDKFRKNPALLSFANSFAAGLFLSVGVFHVLPEAVAEYAKYRTQQGYTYEGFPEDTFPLAFFCAVLGYCGILFLDKVALNSHEMMEHGHQHDHPEEIGHDEENQNLIHSHRGSHIPEQIENQQNSAGSSNEQAAANSSATEDTVSFGEFTPELPVKQILEGIAIGLEKNLSATIDLCIAISIHKWIEALTLGISLMKANVSMNIVYTLLFAFGIASPLGIIIGWSMLEAPLIVSAIFKSVATGTFLYLSATEITNEEFSQKSHRIGKYACFLAGVGFVTLATYME